MKFCPNCQTRYDEDILRFCMKDGTPLVNEEEPKFIEMPSESLESRQGSSHDLSGETDEPGEVTVVRRNRHTQPAPSAPPSIEELDESAPQHVTEKQKIVVPMAAESAKVPVQSYPVQPHQIYQPPSRPNTLLVVFLTMLGTTALLALGATGFWFLTRDSASNSNANANALVNSTPDTNVNTTLGNNSDFLFNVNSDSRANINANIGVNSNSVVKTPTPTPPPQPSPTPALSPSPTPTGQPSPAETPDDLPKPSPTRTPASLPTPLIIRPGQPPSPRGTASPTSRGPLQNGTNRTRVVIERDN